MASNKKIIDSDKIARESNKKVLRFFSALSDETRLRIVLCLADSKKTVGEIHTCIGINKMTLSAVSHQLSYLTNIDIVKYEKLGREKYFQLSDDFCWCILKDAFRHYGAKKICCKRCSQLKKEC